MNALFVTTVSTTLRAFLLPIATHFLQKGWRVSALASRAADCKDCRASFVEAYDIKWTRNPFDPSNLFRVAGRVRQIVDAGSFDIIHVHTPVAAFVTRWALRSRSNRRPSVIYTAHGFHFHRGGGMIKNLIFLALEKLAGRWTDYLVVINREDEEAARRHGIVPDDRVFFMPGIGVDTSAYEPTKIPQTAVASIRSELGLMPGDSLFLMIAEFNPGKRHRDALNALAVCNNKKAHIAFAGAGRLQQTMEALAQAIGVADRVHFLGHRKDIPALIRASVATMLPSEREGLPRSIMESLCLEVPVIGTDIRGVRDLLQGGCGLIVPVGDVQNLAEAMTFILENPAEALQMGHKGRKKMADYDIRQILRLHEELYARALKS